MRSAVIDGLTSCSHLKRLNSQMNRIEYVTPVTGVGTRINVTFEQGHQFREVCGIYDDLVVDFRALLGGRS